LGRTNYDATEPKAFERQNKGKQKIMGRELQCVRRKIGKREAEVENGKNTRGN
jgi:hypothetical protein